jgi:tetratricopeptide (TPR) repeat protein
LRALGRFEEALHHLRRGGAITRQALATNPTEGTLRRNVTSLENEMARALAGQGKWEAALAHSRIAVEAGEQLLAQTRGGRAVPTGNVLSCYDIHVKVLGRLGKLDEVAEASLRIVGLAEETHPNRISGKFVVYTAPTALAAVGEAYESLARRAESPSARLAHQQEACSWFGRSLERWNELRNAGSTIGSYQTRPDEAKKRLAGCQAKVIGSGAAR